MNIRTSAFRGLAILSLSVFGLAACDEGDVIIPEPEPPAIVVTVSPETLPLQVGQKGQLVASVANAENPAVNWGSSNTGVATVNNTGEVTAVAPGQATITATSVEDATKKDAALVTVTAAPVTFTLAPTEANVTVGGTVQLSAVVTGSTNTTVTYQSSSNATATVSATGLVTGVAPGTAIITAIPAADPSKALTATITVSAVAPPTITITPTEASVGVGGTQQFVATVAGATNTAVEFRSANPAVATVDPATGIATGVAQGVTVITAIAQADTTVKASATLTVVGASVAISTIAGGPAGPFTVTANVSVPAGTADSLMITLTNSQTGAVFTVHCQTFTAAGAATNVVCPINPADINPNVPGAQILPNATYTVRAVLVRQNQVAATATFGNPVVTNNANTVNGVVTFDNTRNATDDDPANTTATGPGATVWFGGSVKVDLTASIFAGNPIATIQVVVDENCNLVADAGEAVRTVTLTNGQGSVEFSEANNRGATTPGVNDLQSPAVCFAVINALDANAAAVTLSAAGAGTGNVIGQGTVLNPVFGAGQNQFPIDNVQPAAFAPTLPVWPNSYAGTNSPVNTTTVGGLGAVADAGVGNVTFRFFAVPSANLPLAPTQAQYAASITSTGAVEITNANQLPESTIANNAYTLVVEAKDALGNVQYNEAGDFGVDLTLPTVAIQTVPAVASADNNSINPAAEINVNTTDTFSGPAVIRARLTLHSVLEADANADTDVQCITDNVGTVAALPASGVCPTFDVAVTDQPGTTNETGSINLPDAVGVEGYIVAEVWAVDRAGNQSTDVVTRTVLMDGTAPTGTVDQYTVITATNSISLNGTIRENVDLAAYDIRYNFAGLTTIPTQMPFTAPATVDAYGLPLTGVLSVTGQNAVQIREVTEGVATVTPNQVGFGAWDVAGNFGFISQALAFGGGDGTGLTTNDAGGLNTFDLDVSAATLDRSSGPTTGTLNAIVQVGPTAANPISLVYFYYVHPGSDAVYGGGDDYLVLLGSTGAASVITGVTERTFTFQFPITATVGNPFPIDAFATRVVALAVDAAGDGILSDIPTVTIQP